MDGGYGRKEGGKGNEKAEEEEKRKGKGLRKGLNSNDEEEEEEAEVGFLMRKERRKMGFLGNPSIY